MKRKLSIILTVVLALALCVCVLAGCTENLKQKAIPTVTGGVVASNGGMSVVYGDYLYFINGFAGETAANTFGSVVKGGIARVNLVNGKPDGEAQVIVPKNVYGTDKTYGGIYISGDYIYYASTNAELDGDGKPKTGESVLMRTKVDGTDSRQLAVFDDHSIVFRVAGDNLVYIRSNTIYSINLTGKNFDAVTVAEGVLTGYIMNEDYIFFTGYNEGDSADQLIKVYPLAGGEVKTIVSAALMEKTGVKYTFALLSAIDEGDSVKLFYTKTDDGLNSPETGVYACSFLKSNFDFAAANETRFTRNSNSTTNLAYTQFYKAGPYYLGFASTKLDAFNADGSKVIGSENYSSLNIGTAFTVFDIEETADSVNLWYINSSVVYKICLLSKSGDSYSFVEENTVKIFSGSYDSTYVTLEKIGSVIYYFNSGISNNAYYYVINEGTDASTDTAKGRILGIITEADIISAF